MKKIKIGMVCPYGWDTPGGVQSHMRDLAEYLIGEGHFVSVLAPISDDTITAIIEKAVKSAKDAVTDEIKSYKEEINKLQSELATAKTKAVAGGPKRSVVKTEITEIGEFLAKAAEYRAKAAQTSDADLAKGYRELAEDAELKAKAIQAK